MTKKPKEKYARLAQECRQKSEDAFRPVDRQAWLKLAHDWDRLARVTDLGRMRDQSADRCPHCDESLEIVCVEFRLSCTEMVWACQNCRVVVHDERDSKRTSHLAAFYRRLKRQRR
jgi:hypothetical protein